MKTFYLLYLLLMTGALFALLLNRHKLDRRLYLFIPLLVIALLSEGLQNWSGDEHPLSKLFFALYTPVEYALLSLIIRSFLKDEGKRKLILISIPIFAVVAGIIHVWLKDINPMYKYLDILIQSPLICIWTMFYFLQIASDRADTSRWGNPMFIISVAHLVFFSTAIFSYGIGSYLHYSDYPREDYITVYRIAKYTNIAMYALYMVAFVNVRRRLQWL